MTNRRLFLRAALAGRAYAMMLTLPAHPDVRDGLQTMRDAGLRLVTLTNSAPPAVQQQLANAGLAPFFERSFSVDAVHRLTVLSAQTFTKDVSQLSCCAG